MRCCGTAGMEGAPTGGSGWCQASGWRAVGERLASARLSSHAYIRPAGGSRRASGEHCSAVAAAAAVACLQAFLVARRSWLPDLWLLLLQLRVCWLSQRFRRRAPLNMRMSWGTLPIHESSLPACMQADRLTDRRGASGPRAARDHHRGGGSPSNPRALAAWYQATGGGGGGENFNQ